MIESLIRTALKQRVVVAVMALATPANSASAWARPELKLPPSPWSRLEVCAPEEEVIDTCADASIPVA